MHSRWNDKEAAAFINDPLQLRVYTSRLIGGEPDLVLHGGGNTSVKATVENIFGDKEEIIYVKGSGWDLATIEAPGFAPVKLEVLQRAATLESLTDTEMVRLQRSAMIDPGAPNPSVEAILHAIIPFKFVDHTHTDAVVTITNTPGGEERIKQIYGDRVLIVPYVMPGFILAKTIYDMTRDIDWSKLDAMILLNHGVFTFNDDARACYEEMIRIVDRAEQYLHKETVDKIAIVEEAEQDALSSADLMQLAQLRKAVSDAKGSALIAAVNISPESIHFSYLPDVDDVATRGPLTPDHVIRTKRIPLIFEGDTANEIAAYKKNYEAYFNRLANESHTILDPAPRWAVWLEKGTICFGNSIKEANIINDITAHTIKAIQQGEALGGWQALPEQDIFDVEYWELEQAKLKKGGKAAALQGKIALVTGAASGIGKACVEALEAQGASVVALDINPGIELLFTSKNVLGLICDVTDKQQIKAALELGISKFGGLDILISNAGSFPASSTIEEMHNGLWDNSIAINLTSHEVLLHLCIPYLKMGVDPAIVIVASKNVPAPGPGAGAYSVAKAGLTQLARVAALELGSAGIRVNVLHPNAVYDTAIWTDDVLDKRASHYGLSVNEYKTNNILKTEVSSKDVANLAVAMAGPLFSKTTGAQVPIDGGNDRVI